MSRSRRPPLLSGPSAQRVLAAACLVCGLCSVSPLLAWVYRLGPFQVWYLAVTLPGLALIALILLVIRRLGRHPDLQVAIVAGALGGIAGTIGYDLSRVPLVALGFRLFAPVSSYGLLMTDSIHGSPLTEFLGWTFNFTNGTGFGIAYAMLGLGRRWGWAIPFAFGLETMTIVTPYAGIYGLQGHPDLIAMAYAAHLFYGAPLGIICSRAGRWTDVRAPIPVSLAGAGIVAGLALIFQPWTVPAYEAAAQSAGPQPASLVSAGRFEPEWSRVPSGGCVFLSNRDPRTYHLSSPAGAVLPAGGSGRYCFQAAGVRRVFLNSGPYSGGFVIVDPALPR